MKTKKKNKYKIVNRKTGEEIVSNILLMTAYKKMKFHKGSNADLRIVLNHFVKMKIDEVWVWGDPEKK